MKLQTSIKMKAIKKRSFTLHTLVSDFVFFNESHLFLSPVYIVSREKNAFIRYLPARSHTSTRVSLASSALVLSLSFSLSLWPTHDRTTYTRAHTKFNHIHAHQLIIRRYTMTRACTIHVISWCKIAQSFDL